MVSSSAGAVAATASVPVSVTSGAAAAAVAAPPIRARREISGTASSYLGGRRQRKAAGAATHGDPVLAAGHLPAVALRVPEAERALRHRERHVPGLAGRQQYLLEALQFLRRLRDGRRAGRSDVELGDLGTGGRTGVGHIGLDRRRGDRKVAVPERRVRQPVPEREQRRDLLGVVVPVPDEDALG